MGDWSEGIPYTSERVSRRGCSFGRFTYGVPNIYGDGGHLRVGSFSSIAPDVHIFLATNHRTDWVSTYPFRALSLISDRWEAARDIAGVPFSKGDVVIGNDVWIGFSTIILPGAMIGDGAVIGAGSVVTGNIPPYAVAAGAPARTLKLRFSAEQISQLLDIRWWDWPTPLIEKAVPLLNCEDIDRFIEFAQSEWQD